MSSFSDLSQISDISGISRISCSSGAPWVGKTDSLYTSEYHVNTIHESNKRTENARTNSSKLDKIANTFAVCENSIFQYAQMKLIFDCIKETSVNADKALSDSIAKKLKELLSVHEVNKYIYLPNISKDIKEDELTLLGITDLPKFEMSYEEKLNVKGCVESKLREKIHDFISKYESLGGNLKELSKWNEYVDHKQMLESNEIDLFHWKQEIEEVCADYERDLLKCGNLLNRWRDLKYSEMDTVHVKNAEYLLLQAQVAEMRAQITKLMCIMRMYKETPVTMDAFRILNLNLNEKLSKAKEEIQKKEALKKLYDNLKGTEYDDVLKKYLNLCKAIKKREQLLEQL